LVLILRFVRVRYFPSICHYSVRFYFSFCFCACFCFCFCIARFKAQLGKKKQIPDMPDVIDFDEKHPKPYLERVVNTNADSKPVEVKLHLFGTVLARDSANLNSRALLFPLGKINIASVSYR